MIKKTMTYKDFNDEEQTRDFYFNLTSRELTQMTWTKMGTFDKVLQSIIDAKDYTEMIIILTDVIDLAFGEKSPDGGFYKSPEILAKFKATQAYSDLFMELGNDDVKAMAFLEGLLPADVLAEINKRRAEGEGAVTPHPANQSEAARIAQGKTVPLAAPPATTTPSNQ